MNNITTIGVDLAKNYIQIYGADNRGEVVYKKRVARNKFLEGQIIGKSITGIRA